MLPAVVLLLGGLLVVGTSTAEVDAGWDLLATSAGAPTPRTCFSAKGLPAFVNGTYFVAGPAKFEMGEYKFQALFDGYGRMNRFELRGGEVCYTSAWLNTGFYRSSLQRGRPSAALLFEETVPPRPSCGFPACNMMGPNDNNWVNVIPVGNEALLMSDTLTMLSMDTETLNVSGRKSWADDKQSMMGPPSPAWMNGMHTGAGGSAHPLQIPGTDTWVEIAAEMPEGPGRNWMDIYTFDGSVTGPQRRKKIGSTATTSTQYIHSFGLTESHAVLTFNYKMQVNPLTTKVLLGAIQEDWHGIHVMDFAGNWQVFKSDPFFHVHTVNTFENASGIVMDLGFYLEMPFGISPQLDIGLFMNKTARDLHSPHSGVRRLLLHTDGPLKGSATQEDLVPPTRGHDFFNINPTRRGRPYCIYWCNEWWHDDRSYASMAILKHDLCKGTKTYWSRKDVYPGEPFFIGREGAGRAEDDGVVVFVALDGQSRTSRFITVDARSMEELSVVELPGHIPFTAHGNFIPAGAPTRDGSGAAIFV